MFPNFFKKDGVGNIFEVSSPFIFYTFGNQTLMSVAQKLLALQLAHHNEASFFVCKMFWKRVFNRELHLNK